MFILDSIITSSRAQAQAIIQAAQNQRLRRRTPIDEYESALYVPIPSQTIFGGGLAQRFDNVPLTPEEQQQQQSREMLQGLLRFSRWPY